MAPAAVRNVTLSFHARAPTFIAPVADVFPKTRLPHPLVILAISAFVNWMVPACPVPRPIVVAAKFAKIDNVPVPVRAAFKTISASVLMVRLLAAIVCAPLTVITPPPLRNVKTSFQVFAVSSIAPLASVRPNIKPAQPLVMRPCSAAVRLTVPTAAFPIPMLVAVVD